MLDFTSTYAVKLFRTSEVHCLHFV